MPIRKPREQEEQKPLFSGYLSRSGENIGSLARKLGISRSRIYDALHHGVGHENAGKIAAHIGGRLGLSKREKLELQAELMGTPDNLARAFLGTKTRTANLLDIDYDNAGRVLDPEGRITHAAGLRAVERLAEIEAPHYLVESVRERILPPVEHQRGRGRVVHPESERATRMGRQKARLAKTKPRLDEALLESGLSLEDLSETAGIGREALRKALYEAGGAKAAKAIATTLGERLGLPEERVALIAWEIIRGPKEV